MLKKLLKWTGDDNSITIGKEYKIYDDGAADDQVFPDDWNGIRRARHGTWEDVIEEEPATEGSYAAAYKKLNEAGPLSDDPLVNPKKAIGAVKAPMYACPMEPLVELENVMACGATKYGVFNYRESQVDALTYQGAMKRHMLLWFAGMDNDDETNQSHLAHVMACCVILMDAQSNNMLIDNRSKMGSMQALLKKSEEDFAKFVKEYEDGTL
jgi:hypothetical protein